jgi:hypothetical protein
VVVGVVFDAAGGAGADVVGAIQRVRRLGRLVLRIRTRRGRRLCGG